MNAEGIMTGVVIGVVVTFLLLALAGSEGLIREETLIKWISNRRWRLDKPKGQQAGLRHSN